MPLTEIQARNSKPRERAYKMADGEGLFLFVQPNGSKLWRMKYRFAGKEKLLSFGAYPDLGIAAARDKRTAAKALLAEGKDPMKSKGEVISQEGATFFEVAKRWHENRKSALNDLPGLIQSVYASLASLGQVPEPTEEVRTPAVSVRASVKPDAVTCLDCGAKFKMLKHHLSTDHGMTPAEYRARWNLAADYPMVAPDYAARRKELALKIGLGRNLRRPEHGHRRALEHDDDGSRYRHWSPVGCGLT